MEVDPHPTLASPCGPDSQWYPLKGEGSTLADRTLLARGPVSFWAANPLPLISGCQALGTEGQGSLACCSPWGHKELDMTQQLNTHTTTG